MERLIKYKACMVWLLVAVLALPFAVKTVHIHRNSTHQEHSDCSEHSHSHHDCDNCPVCQFILSVFTEDVFTDHDFSIIPAPRFEPVVHYRNTVYQRILLPCGLRAPPSV